MNASGKTGINCPVQYREPQAENAAAGKNPQSSQNRTPYDNYNSADDDMRRCRIIGWLLWYPELQMPIRKWLMDAEKQGHSFSEAEDIVRRNVHYALPEVHKQQEERMRRIADPATRRSVIPMTQDEVEFIRRYDQIDKESADARERSEESLARCKAKTAAKIAKIEGEVAAKIDKIKTEAEGIRSGTLPENTRFDDIIHISEDIDIAEEWEKFMEETSLVLFEPSPWKSTHAKNRWPWEKTWPKYAPSDRPELIAVREECQQAKARLERGRVENAERIRQAQLNLAEMERQSKHRAEEIIRQAEAEAAEMKRQASERNFFQRLFGK
ncbi:MAG: hypothetical protein LBI69_03510 [Puniceicoccales bacterium]|nr:hypothetical protein [Puniceicoccales bacterium]